MTETWYKASFQGNNPLIDVLEVQTTSKDGTFLVTKDDVHVHFIIDNGSACFREYNAAVRWLRGRVDDDASRARTELSRAMQARDKVYKLFQLRKDEA